MDQLPSFIVIGYTNIDVNILPSKKTILPGGGAYFAAIAASRITQPIGLVTRIGRDFDTKFLLQRVLPQGVHIIVDKPTARSTQMYYSETDPTKRDIKLDWGVAPDLNPKDIPQPWLKNVRSVHIATMPPQQQAKFIPFLRQNAPQATIAIDSDQFLYTPEHLPTLMDNFANADIVFANRHEYEKLKDFFGHHQFAVIKQDQDGAFIMKKGKVIVQKSAPHVSVVDVTGAGDIFAGTFLAHLLKGDTEEDSLEQAIAIASQSTTAEGVIHLFHSASHT